MQTHALHAVLRPLVLLSHPHVSPWPPLNTHGRCACTTQLVRHEVEVTIGGAVVQLPRGAQQSRNGGEKLHRLQLNACTGPQQILQANNFWPKNSPEPAR